MLKHILAATFICLSAVAHAAPEQRTCQFEKVLTPTGEMQDTNWTATLAKNGADARVAVDGSDEYQGTAKNSANGTAEFAFSTGVSKEIITIGPDGSALWQINFDDKRTMAYFGVFNAAQRT